MPCLLFFYFFVRLQSAAECLLLRYARSLALQLRMHWREAMWACVAGGLSLLLLLNYSIMLLGKSFGLKVCPSSCIYGSHKHRHESRAASFSQ